jgi:exosome complex component RRP4
MFSIFNLQESSTKALKRSSFPLDNIQIVNPGETITSDAAYMRGHGSYSAPGNTLLSSLSGRVERVNKLICVEPLKSRYNGEVGDVVIGRIVEVGTKRWKVDTNSRQHSALMLSSISLPGGVLRRKLESDELQMRNYLVEGDVICVSVFTFMSLS